MGVYWFSYALTVTQAIDEAEFCATTIKPYKLDLPVYFDFEYDTERYAKQNGVIYYPRLRTDIHNAFCNRIKEHGYAAGIYTNVDYILSKNYMERIVATYIMAGTMAAWRKANYT